MNRSVPGSPCCARRIAAETARLHRLERRTGLLEDEATLAEIAGKCRERSITHLRQLRRKRPEGAGGRQAAAFPGDLSVLKELDNMTSARRLHE